MWTMAATEGAKELYIVVFWKKDQLQVQLAVLEPGTEILNPMTSTNNIFKVMPTAKTTRRIFLLLIKLK